VLVLIGIVSGALAGSLAGFALSVVVLFSLRLANVRRVRRGEIAFKNEIRPRLEVPCGVLGAITGAIASALHGLVYGLIAGAAVPFAAFVFVYLVALVWVTVLNRFNRPPDPPDRGVDGGPFRTVPSRRNQGDLK
jgi:hypothetical protein